MVKAKSLVNELELYVERTELEEFGLTEEEIEGYFEFFSDSLFIKFDSPDKQNVKN